MAEHNAAKITIDPVTSPSNAFKENGSTIPDATAFATPTNVIAPTKFITAANNTATRGFSARVETEVAIALAVSWNPLIKSNANAKMTTSTVIINNVSIIYSFFIMHFA